MIHALLVRMIARLDADFDGVGTPVISAGPADPPTTDFPRIVLSPGKLQLPPPIGELPAGEMQPRDTTDTFAVNTASPATVQGPYTLSQSALEGTVSCRFSWMQPGDELEGKKLRIYPRKGGQGDGFEIDHSTGEVAVFYAAPLAGVPTLEVAYRYPAVFTMRSFHQLLLLEAYATTPADAEKWAALSAAILTTRAKSLLEEANDNSNFQSSGSYVTRSLFNTFQLSEGLLDRASSTVCRFALTFAVTGQLTLERTFTENLEVIRKVFSPGHRGDPGTINIEPNLD
jgi:hypothetical protein